MNTKIKIITILLMTLFVLGGGVLFYSNQLADRGANGWVFLVVDEQVSATPQESFIPEVRSDQLDSYKPSSRGDKGGDSDDMFSSKITNDVSTKVDNRASSLSRKGSPASAYQRSHSDNKIYSNGGSAGSNQLLSYGSRSSGGSEIASTGGGSGVGNGMLFAPSLGDLNDSWVLIDPEPTTNQIKDKIVPVGGGVYVLSLLSLLYGLFIFIRRRHG